jgi:hypothetical protein
MILLTSFLLTGCIKVVIRVNEDGSGTYEMAIAMSPTQIQQMNTEEPDPDLQGILNLMDEPVTDQESGITFSAKERIENAQRWTYIIAQIPDLDHWGQIQSASERVFGPDEDVEESDVLGVALQQPIVTREGNQLRVDLAVPDYTSGSEEENNEAMAMLQKIITWAIEIDLAGDLIDHNGQIDSLTGHPVWFLDLASPEPMDIYAVSEVK